MSKYQVYKINADDPKFSKVNLRLQAIILLFINGANFIYIEPFWKYFMLYKIVRLVRTRNLMLNYMDFRQMERRLINL